MTVTVSGSAPLRLEFSDGSSHEYALDDPILHVMIGEGDPAHSMPEDGPVLCDMVWPEDIAIEVNGDTITPEAAAARMASFIVDALRHALEDAEAGTCVASSEGEET